MGLYENITSAELDNILINLHTSIVMLDIAFFISGLTIMIMYNPLNYGCDHISKKFLLGLYICIISVINLVYVW